MRKLTVAFSLFFLSVCLLLGAQASKKPHAKKTTPEPVASAFALECSTLPFAAIAPATDPFVECGNCGVVSQPASSPKQAHKAAQSHAKNDFCADTSRVTDVTFANLRDLQKQSAEKNLVNTDLPDRTQLALTLNGNPIKEGSVVRLVAWVQDAHLSDCRTGESVNCQTGGAAHNDIHIVLLDPTSGGRDQDACSSVTAEMSPHFRPRAWSELNHKIPASNVIRVTGPLFFDNAHRPCAGLTKNSGPHPDMAPFRSSLWEVHPVYAFDVCKNTDATRCDISDSSAWQAYDQWVADPSNNANTVVTTAHEGCPQTGTQAAGALAARCPSN